MDLNNYPPNKKGREPMPEKKKVEPVIDRVPEVREQSNVKKFFNNFIASDVKDVKEYVVMKVLLPRVQAMLLDMIRNGAEMLIMGPNAARNRNNYNSYSRGGTIRQYDGGGSRPARQPGTTYVPYAEPLLESEEEALDIIDRMIDYVEEYPCLSISDFLGFCNRPQDDEYTYQNYGWTRETILSCRPEQIPDGRFVIKLPRPRYIR